MIADNQNLGTATKTKIQLQPRSKVVTDLSYDFVDSPLGDLLVAGSREALFYLSFPTGNKAFGPHPSWLREPAEFQNVRAQLGAYFDNKLTRFDLPLVLSGTPFQTKVWDALTTIPFGQTRNYSEIATAIGRPDACRAVGAANGNNPLPIILPCHRVIGKNGALTGFGGGLASKQLLLEHELIDAESAYDQALAVA